MYLLSDEEEIVSSKTEGLERIRAETQEVKEAAALNWDELFAGFDGAESAT